MIRGLLGSEGASRLGGEYSGRFAAGISALDELCSSVAFEDDMATSVQLVYLHSAPELRRLSASGLFAKDAFGANVAVDGNAIMFDDLVLGVAGGRLSIRHRYTGSELRFLSFDAVTLAAYPPELRFLLSVSRLSYPTLHWDWGEALAHAVHLPAVTYRSVMISAERWLVPPGLSPEELSEWAERNDVPRRIRVGTGDQILHLDIREAEQCKLLIESVAMRGTWIESDPTVSGSQVATEYVLTSLDSRSARRTAQRNHVIAPHSHSVEERAQLGNISWHAFALYCREPLWEQVLCDLRAIIPRTFDWFFVRYFDPKPVLRVRVRRHFPVARLDDLLGLIRSIPHVYEVQVQTYLPEIDRYGGTSRSMAAAENIFVADSQMVVESISLLGRPSSLIECYASCVEYLTAILPENRDRIGVISELSKTMTAEALDLERVDRQTLRRLYEQSREQLGSIEKRSPVTRSFIETAAHASELFEKLDANSHKRIGASLLHMHSNRIGLDRRGECIVYDWMRRRTPDRASY